jgi:enoyl-CoA hydratase
MSSTAADILFERRGAAGIVTLNRPKALNAVTHGMVRALRTQLDRWASDPAVTRVVVMAAGARAFSAGGDIRALFDLGKAGRIDEALQFWRDEYPLNLFIKNYRKPYIALIDGIAMGGGVGISVHGSHRIAGDQFSFAMPEVGIGFFPDVGATWFLPRMPGGLGTYCALTGDRFGMTDAVFSGVATHRIASTQFDAVLDGLTGAVPVDALLSAFAKPVEQGPIAQRRTAIDRIFLADRIEDIFNALDREGQSSSADAEWARKTAAAIRTKSPLSLKIAFAQVRRGKDWDFETCMRTEYRIVSRIIQGHDFYEGVRAVIVDKDNRPRWQPAGLDDVKDADVERHFAALGDDELVLP